MKYKERYLAGYLARLFLKNPLTMILGVSLIVLGVIALLVNAQRKKTPQISITRWRGHRLDARGECG